MFGSWRGGASAIFTVARGSSGRVNLSFDLFQRRISFYVKPLCTFKSGEVLCETDINGLVWTQALVFHASVRAGFEEHFCVLLRSSSQLCSNPTLNRDLQSMNQSPTAVIIQSTECLASSAGFKPAKLASSICCNIFKVMGKGSSLLSKKEPFWNCLHCSLRLWY